MMYVKNGFVVVVNRGSREKSWPAFRHELLKKNWSTMGFMPSSFTTASAVGD